MTGDETTRRRVPNGAEVSLPFGARSNEIESPLQLVPAQRHPAASRGGDPVFAGIHVFLAGFQLKKT